MDSDDIMWVFFKLLAHDVLIFLISANINVHNACTFIYSAAIFAGQHEFADKTLSPEQCITFSKSWVDVQWTHHAFCPDLLRNIEVNKIIILKPFIWNFKTHGLVCCPWPMLRPGLTSVQTHRGANVVQQMALVWIYLCNYMHKNNFHSVVC